MNAIPRPIGLNTNRDAIMTGGNYGIMPWKEPSSAGAATSQNSDGRRSVADRPSDFSGWLQ